MRRPKLPEYDKLLVSSRPVNAGGETVYIDTFDLGRKVTIAYWFSHYGNKFLGAYGYSVCNPEDKFVKSLGEAISVGRLFLRDEPQLDIKVSKAPPEFIDNLKSDFIEDSLSEIHEAISQLESAEFMSLLTTVSTDIATRKKKDKIIKQGFPSLQ